MTRLFGPGKARTSQSVLGNTRKRNDENLTSWMGMLDAVKKVFGGENSISIEAVLGIPTVFACINKISKTIAQTPCHLYRRKSNDEVERVLDHPLSELLRLRASKDVSAYHFRYAMTATMLLKGNAYAKVGRTKGGDIVYFEILEPTDVKISYGSDPTKAAIYTMKVEDGKTLTFNGDQILHLKGPTWDGINGTSATKLAVSSIKLAQYLLKNAINYFKNGSRPGLILKSTETLNDQETIDRLRESIKAAYEGDDNAFKTLVLEGGMDAIFASRNNETDQQVQQRKLQNEEICRLFDVPQHKVGLLDRATNNNIEDQSIDYIRDTIQPHTTVWEQELNYKCLDKDERGQGLYAEFNLDAQLRGNTLQRYQAYQIGRQNGFLTANEIRRLENLNPVEGGDELFTPANLIPLSPGPMPETNAQPTPEADPQNPDDNASSNPAK